MKSADSPRGQIFSVAIERQGPYCIVRLAGELDIATTSKLRRVLKERLVDAGEVNIVVDLTELDFMDSSGLGVLIGMHKRARALRGSLAVVCPDGPVLRVMSITGLLHVLHVHASLEAATAEPPEPRTRQAPRGQ